MTRPARSTHGSYGYARTNRCRCEPCVTARTRYDKMQRLKRARGETNRVDSTSARDHVQRFVDAGATYHQVALATGEAVKEGQIRRLMEGNRYNGGKPVAWIYRPTEQALLALTTRKVLKQEAIKPAFGAHRRLQALLYMGHPIGSLADELGVTPEVIARYLRADRLMNSTLHSIDEMYQRLAMVRGDSERMRWRAYRNDWAPPMAWDEDTLDDPDAKPDRSGIRCVVNGCMRAAQKRSICDAHLRRIKVLGGFHDAESFREMVIKVGKQETHAGDDLRETLSELKELGVTPEEAAQRTGRRRSHIERIWGEVA